MEANGLPAESPANDTSNHDAKTPSPSIPISHPALDSRFTATLEDPEATPYVQLPASLPKDILKHHTHETRELEPYHAIPATLCTGPDLRQREQDELASRLARVTFDAPYKGITGAEVYDIAADGHCLFRSLAHQLSLYLPFEVGSSNAMPDYVALRQACRQEILRNPNDYAPFLLNDEGNLLDPEGIRDYAERIGYCGPSPVWGSHLEVSIVSKLFQRPIMIIGSDFNVTVGEGIPERSKSKLFISFHKHLYSSEHYNSLVPVSFDAAR